MIIIHVIIIIYFSIVSPPSSVTVSGVSNPYDIGQPVAVDCTVIAVVLDPRNRARIRWRGVNNNVIKSMLASPLTINNTYNINYTYPLTITINLSDAGQYNCISRIQTGGVTNLIASDFTQYNFTIIFKRKFIQCILSI